ncbi:MAG: hypothetical protein K0R49_1263 [Burkholderiales bacterium]|jgi:hypothetical protein|nr:hypothetical protein [Burkholderiales bacterium]
MNQEQMDNLAKECDKAIDSRETSYIKQQITDCEKFINNLDKKDSHFRPIILYCMGNLYSGLASTNNELSTNWEMKHPNTRNYSIDALNAYRLSEKTRSWEGYYFQLKTNIALKLSFFNRYLEAFDYHCLNFNIKNDAPFVSYRNKIEILKVLAQYIESDETRQEYYIEAYHLSKELFKLVQGGICPLGGTECHNGQPIEITLAHNNKALKTYGPVVGGCGNCRFFSTGPAFLVQQAQVANELMLECRAIGQQKNQLLEQLNQLDWKNTTGLTLSEAQLLNLDRQALKDKILELDLALEPKIIEWVNRYKMLEESNKLLDDWRSDIGSNTPKNDATKTPLLLVAGADHAEFHKELEIRFKKASDFSLVRNILEGAKLRGGLAKASSIAKEHLREFTDRILRVENAKHLLIDIRDRKILEEATFLMASLLESLVGDEHIQECLDTGKPLGLEKKEHKLLLDWAEEIVTMANNSQNKSLKMVDLLPKHIS